MCHYRNDIIRITSVDRDLRLSQVTNDNCSCIVNIITAEEAKRLKEHRIGVISGGSDNMKLYRVREHLADSTDVQISIIIILFLWLNININIRLCRISANPRLWCGRELVWKSHGKGSFQYLHNFSIFLSVRTLYELWRTIKKKKYEPHLDQPFSSDALTNEQRSILICIENLTTINFWFVYYYTAVVIILRRSSPTRNS